MLPVVEDVVAAVLAGAQDIAQPRQTPDPLTLDDPLARVVQTGDEGLHEQLLQPGGVHAVPVRRHGARHRQLRAWSGCKQNSGSCRWSSWNWSSRGPGSRRAPSREIDEEHDDSATLSEWRSVQIDGDACRRRFPGP